MFIFDNFRYINIEQINGSYNNWQRLFYLHFKKISSRISFHQIQAFIWLDVLSIFSILFFSSVDFSSFSVFAVSFLLSFSVFSSLSMLPPFSPFEAFLSQSPGHHPILAAADDRSPNPAPILPNKRTPIPVAPKDCKIANKLPAATDPIHM